MASKKQVEEAFKELMGPKGKSIVIWSDKKTDNGEFEIRNESNNKFGSGKIGFQGNRLELEIKFTNYNQNYIKTKLRNGFQGSRMPSVVITRKKPTVGSVVLTKEFLNPPLPLNKDVQIQPRQKYFAIDDDNINCAGDFFNQTMKGRIMEYVNRRCPGGPENRYSRIEITL